MLKFDTYDENVLVNILRNGKEQTVPFCELVTGDIVWGGELNGVTVGIDAHYSDDNDYDGWLLFDQNGVDYYPEDFGGKRTRTT